MSGPDFGFSGNPAPANELVLGTSQFTGRCIPGSDVPTPSCQAQGTKERMPFKSPNVTLVLLIALVGVAFFGLVHAIIGSGRSVGAYILGALALIGCVVLVLVVVAAVGWLLDRIAERFGK